MRESRHGAGMNATFTNISGEADLIETVRGVGYRFREAVATD